MKLTYCDVLRKYFAQLTESFQAHFSGHRNSIFSPLEFILDFLFTWEHLEVPPTNHKSTLGFEYAAFFSWNTPFLHTYISL